MDTAIHLRVPRTALQNKELSDPDVDSAEVEDPCSGGGLFSYLEMWKVKLREIEQFIQGHTGGKWPTIRNADRCLYHAMRMWPMGMGHSFISNVWTLLHLIPRF